MAELLSIYRKDYLWPARKPYFPRTDLRCTIAAPVITPTPPAVKICSTDPKPDEDQSREIKGSADGAAEKVKLGTCPRTEALEFSETDACLKKMFRENPNLFSVMRKLPSTDAIKKFNAERLKTIYQIDFDHMVDQPPSSLPEAPNPCPSSATPEVNCRPQMSSRAELMKRRRGGTSDSQSDPCNKKSKSSRKRKSFDETDQPDFMLRVLPAWTSEYREAIDKTGAEIMREMRMSPRKRAARLRRKRIAEQTKCDDAKSINPRLEKSRKSPQQYHSQSASKGDGAHELLYTDSRYGESPRSSFPTRLLDSPTGSDNEFKVSDEQPTSNDDSVSLYDTYHGSPDGNGDIDQHYREIAADLKREKLLQEVTYSPYPNNKRTTTYATENYDDLPLRSNLQRKSQDYSDKQAYETGGLARRKLQRLKELERRRDYTEKYYTQEIRRLIGDQYFDGKPSAGPTATANTRHAPTDKAFTQSYAGDRATPGNALDNLEACGTMTTITRLTCGCVEQTTRPIFTTASGRVQKRNCSQEQQVHMKLSAPSARLVLNNHSQPPVPTTPKLKSKSYNEPRSAATATASNNNNNRNLDGDVGGRSTSPARKISDSSVFSA